jgi:hypothetical protein
LRECLAKDGVTLPRFKRGQRPAGGFLGGNSGPTGANRAKYEAALKKCGGSLGAGRFNGFAGSAAAKQSLTKFATCMREHGVDLPTPNTSGNGPIFNTSRLNVAGEKFKAAESKCSSDLRGAFGGRRGPRGGRVSPGGAPPGPGAGAAPVSPEAG